MKSRKLSRIATLAVLPIIAIVVTLVARADFGSASGQEDPLLRGTLVLASPRSQSLTFYRFDEALREESLHVPGPPHELGASGDRLYVTLGRGDAVIEVLASAPGILRTLPLRGEPHGLAIAGDELLVTLDAAGELLTIDRNSLSIRGRVATGDRPHAVVVAEGVSYVTQSGDNRLWTSRGGLALSTGAQPESVAIVGDRVVTADRGGSLSIFTRPPFAFVVRLTLEGGPVRVVAVDDVHVAVSLGDDERVAIVDIDRAELVETLDVGSHPDGLCLSPDGVFLAAVSSGAGQVKIYRLADWRRVLTLRATALAPGACLWL